MSTNPWEVYDILIERAQETLCDAALYKNNSLESMSLYSGDLGLEDESNGVSAEVADVLKVQQVIIGLTWTLCRNDAGGAGLAMSPGQYTRTLPWSGTLIHRPVREIFSWVKSWNPFEAAVGLAAINSVLNSNTTALAAKAVPIFSENAPNLSVFDFFLPRLKNKKVVVIGRYPGLEQYDSILDLTVLERAPQHHDLPDPACEFLLKEADWVFLTANSLANKTFPRLADLCRDAVTVLMGPSLPWIDEWLDYGIDFLAGVQVLNHQLLLDTVAEGGGVRIFNQALRYQVVDLSQNEMQWLKTNIADLVAKREQLKAEMDIWYAQDHIGSLMSSRFPKRHLLEQIDQELSVLDLKFKRQWDARHSGVRL